MNGCPNITSAGMAAVIQCCSQDLLEFEIAGNNQDLGGTDYLKALGTCWNLQLLDLTACPTDDKGFKELCCQQVKFSTGTVEPGLIQLHTLKLSGTKITDSAMQNIFKRCEALTHLELNRCTDLTDLTLKQFVIALPKLTFLDLSGIKDVTLTLLNEIKEKKPDLNMR